MKALSAIRRRATYATVLATITAVAVLTGAGALAASQLGKNSVGAKQLKKNSVTTAKIKKNAVTTAKIRANAVTSAKVKDGSLEGANLQTAGSAYMRIVHEARGTGTTPLGEEPIVLPLSNPTYTQAAGEDDFFYGAVDVAFLPSCEGKREIEAVVLVDPADPSKPGIFDFAGYGSFEPETGGAASGRLTIGPFQVNAGRFQARATASHTLYVVASVECETGSGATASNPAIDVIGVR